MSATDAARAGAVPAAGSLRAWVLACRPATLPVGAVPVLVGAAAAAGAGEGGASRVRAGAVLAALAGALAIQVGTNLANDVFDFEKGADTRARVGPARATQAGLLTPRQVRGGMLAAFALATLAGVYLAAVAGWVVVAIGLASIASGVAYTGGPWPLGYHGLGDAFVFAFFGPVAVCGTALVATGEVPLAAWLASAAVGALATAVLVVNNVRDRETDAVAGKRTLAVRLGRAFGAAEYAGLCALAYGAPVALWALGLARAWVLATWLTAPAALALARAVAREEGAALNARLAGTARLLLAFGALLAAGLAAR